MDPFAQPYKSVLFTIRFPDVKIKIQLVNFVGLEKTVIELATGCLRTMKSYYVYIN